MRNFFLVVGFVLATVAFAIVVTGGFNASLSVNLRVATLHNPTDSSWVGWEDSDWSSHWDRWDDQDWKTGWEGWNDPSWEKDRA